MRSVTLMLFVLASCRSAIHAAAERGNEHDVRRHSPGSLEFREAGRTPLLTALRAANSETAKTLLSLGADANAVEYRHGAAFATPLIYAVSLGDDELASTLIRNGARIDGTGFLEMTALHEAARTGHAGLVKLLLGSGASPNRVDALGRTPIVWAVLSGREACVSELVLHTHELDLPDNYGRSAKAYAALLNRREILNMLTAAENGRQHGEQK